MNSMQLRWAQNWILILPILLCHGCADDSPSPTASENTHELVGTWKLECLPNADMGDRKLIFNADGSKLFMGTEGTWETPEAGLLHMRTPGIRHGTAGSNVTKDYSAALYKI